MPEVLFCYKQDGGSAINIKRLPDRMICSDQGVLLYRNVLSEIADAAFKQMLVIVSGHVAV